MSDENEPVITGVSDVVEAAQVPAPPAPEAEEEEDEQNEPEESAPSDGEDPPAKPKNRGVGKRIDELTRDKYDAIRREQEVARERDYWREQAQKAATPTPTQAAGRPTLEAYNFDQEAYFEALADWKADQKLQGFKAEQSRAEAERQQQEKAERFRQRVAELEREIPGAWQEAVTAPVPTTPAMLEVIAESDIGPRIAHYLATHLDEAAEISRMSPLATAKALGRIESELSAPKASTSTRPPTVTKAPAPVSTLRPAAPIKKDLGEMDMDEYIAERTRQRKALGLIR